MARFIILSPSDAALVRGPTSPHAALDPVILADGTTYVLPEDVLSDPAHAVRRDYLLALVVREVLASEFITNAPG